MHAIYAGTRLKDLELLLVTIDLDCCEKFNK